jgi:hypothetical protein
MSRFKGKLEQNCDLERTSRSSRLVSSRLGRVGMVDDDGLD